MAYKFKLETLLTFRQNLEELAQQKLAGELRILAAHKEHLRRLIESKVNFVGELEESKSTKMDSSLYIFYVESMQNADFLIRSQNDLIESQKGIVETARGDLAEKIKSRKIIEKAKERDYRKYQQEMIRLEYKENDEIAVLRDGMTLHAG